MMRKKTIKSETTHNGTLNTRIAFHRMMPSDDVFEGDSRKETIFQAWGDVYSPSMKDIEVLNGHGVKSGMTVKIRDPLTGYYPDNSDTVTIFDPRCEGKEWGIVEVRPDFSRDYLTILLRG